MSSDLDYRRLDYMLSCPEGLSNMPSLGMPHLLYSAFWESADAAALIIKDAIYDGVNFDDDFSAAIEKPEVIKKSNTWHRRRTTLKVRTFIFARMV